MYYRWSIRWTRSIWRRWWTCCRRPFRFFAIVQRIRNVEWSRSSRLWECKRRLLRGFSFIIWLLFQDPFASSGASGGGGAWGAATTPNLPGPGGGKRPPPRPAPPKSRPITPKDPMAGGGADPFSSAPADPWGGNEAGGASGGGGFADFADFGKFSWIDSKKIGGDYLLMWALVLGMHFAWWISCALWMWSVSSYSMCKLGMWVNTFAILFSFLILFFATGLIFRSLYIDTSKQVEVYNIVLLGFSKLWNTYAV